MMRIFGNYCKGRLFRARVSRFYRIFYANFWNFLQFQIYIMTSILLNIHPDATVDLSDAVLPLLSPVSPHSSTLYFNMLINIVSHWRLSYGHYAEEPFWGRKLRQPVGTRGNFFSLIAI